MLRLFLFCIAALISAACSGGGSPAPTMPALPTGSNTPTAPSGPLPSPTPTVTITAAGMTPLDITINAGQRVTFVNNDTRAHDLVGGVDPNHPDCPEITLAGFLTPGQSRETGVFTAARTCEYHDHTMLSVPAFQGRIIIR
jgi:plastocyanin